MTQTRSSQRRETQVGNAAHEQLRRADRTIKHEQAISTVAVTHNMAYRNAAEQKAQHLVSITHSSTDVRDWGPVYSNPDLPLPSIERTPSISSSPSVSSPGAGRLRTPSFTLTPPPSDQVATPVASITPLSPSPQPTVTLGELSCQLGSLSVNNDEQGISSKNGSCPIDDISSSRPPVPLAASPGVMTSRDNTADAITAPMSSLALRETSSIQENTSSDNLLDPLTPNGMGKEKVKSPRRRSHDRRRSSTADVQTRHNVSDETPPENKFHQPAFQSAITQTEGLVATIVNLIESSNLHNEKDSSMGKLFALASELTKHKPATNRVVGLVGDSGAGKSSLINSLLDVQDLARSSGSGAACTCVATEYHYHNRSDFAIHIEYFSSEEIASQFKDLLQAARLHSNSKNISTDSNSTSKDEIAAVAQKADMAVNTFRAAFGSRFDLHEILLKGTEHEVLERLLAEARSLQLTPVLVSKQEWSEERFDRADECSKRLKDLTSEHPGLKAAWPFIRKIKVSLNAHILSRGIVLADLPGLRDLNSARVNVTEKYLLSCHEIFAVCAISRATTDVGVKEVFELAQRARLPKVGIICTKSDQIQAKEAENDWKGHPEADKIQKMREEWQKIATEIAKLNTDLEELEEFPDSEDEQERLDLYQQKRQKEKDRSAKEFALHSFIVATRNQKISNALQKKYNADYPGVASDIFCVSNTHYWGRRFKSRVEYYPYLELSGIMELRKHCLSIVAERQCQAAKDYMQNSVPALLNSLELWIQAGSGSLSAEKKQIIRNAMKSLSEQIDALTGPLSDISRISTVAEQLFRSHILAYMSAQAPQWAVSTVHVSQPWQGFHHSTFAACCRKFGNHHYPSWNDEIVSVTLAALCGPWCQFTTSLENTLNEFLRSAEGRLEATAALGQIKISTATSIAILSTNIRHKNQLLRSEMELACEEFQHQLDSLETEVLSGVRTSILGQLLEPSYNACNMESGKGSDRRRKDIIARCCQDRQLFNRHRRRSAEKFSALINGLQERINNASATHAMAIRQDIAIVEEEHVITEAERSPEFRENLSKELSSARSLLENLTSSI